MPFGSFRPLSYLEAEKERVEKKFYAIRSAHKAMLRISRKKKVARKNYDKTANICNHTFFFASTRKWQYVSIDQRFPDRFIWLVRREQYMHEQSYSIDTVAMLHGNISFSVSFPSPRLSCISDTSTRNFVHVIRVVYSRRSWRLHEGESIDRSITIYVYTT